MKTKTINGVQFVDTLTLLISYDDNREARDLFEIRKRVMPIREKMRSSRDNNLYVEVYKPRNLPVDAFCGMLGADLASYGFSDVIVSSADSYRQRNGATRSFLESIFSAVEFPDSVLPVKRDRSKKSAKEVING